jgi:hypothetical protein
MNCYDCKTIDDLDREAAAICADCGAAVCVGHAVTTLHWLTRTQAIERVVRVEPAARTIRCGTCHAAHAARGDVAPAAAAS